MGRRAALELARTPGVERVTVAGRSLASAQRAQSQIVETLLAQDPSRLSACEVAVAAVDAADQEAVARLMDDHHVAVGALGPFYLYEETMVRAAIDVRTPYVSICDDGDAAAEIGRASCRDSVGETVMREPYKQSSKTINVGAMP